MINTTLVQYLGFAAKPRAREYTFNVREAGVAREFTLNIANEEFVNHHARYQDGPAICVVRLNAELAAHSNHPPESQFTITAAELETYRESSTPKSKRVPAWKKPQENF